MLNFFATGCRGKGAMTPGPTRSAAGFQVSPPHPTPAPPLRSQTDVMSPPVEKQVALGRGSHSRRESASAGRLAKTGLCGIV